VEVAEFLKVSSKNKYVREDAMGLVDKVEHISVSKGRKQTYFDLTKESPDEDTLMEHLLGRTGNMRAPTVLFGKQLLVGFNADMYSKVLLGE